MPSKEEIESEESDFPTHPPVRSSTAQTNPVARYNLRTLAHSTDTWSLCDNAPSFKENLLVKNDDEFEDWLFEDTRRMVHQGVLDNCDN